MLRVTGVPHMPLTATTQQLSSACPLLVPSPSSLPALRRAFWEPSPSGQGALGVGSFCVSRGDLGAGKTPLPDITCLAFCLALGGLPNGTDTMVQAPEVLGMKECLEP